MGLPTVRALLELDVAGARKIREHYVHSGASDPKFFAGEVVITNSFAVIDTGEVEISDSTLYAKNTHATEGAIIRYDPPGGTHHSVKLEPGEWCLVPLPNFAVSKNLEARSATANDSQIFVMLYEET